MSLLWSKDEHDVSVARYCLANSARKIESIAQRYVFFKTLLEPHRGEAEWQETIKLWDKMTKLCWKIGER